MIRCSDCGDPYPPTGVPYLCPKCGGVYDFDAPPLLQKEHIENDQPGLWRYRHSFELFDGAPGLTLGEGGTPLIWETVNEKRVGIKLESLNPSGSYKDRGTAVMINQLLARGVKRAVEDSSGNAGASFAAYAARAGLKAQVFVPSSASGPKRVQIERYGAELIPVEGPRSAAAQAVLAEVEKGAVYASHAYLPFGLAGIATIAYELWEALGSAPGCVVAPVGQGGLLLGIRRGFAALQRQGLIAAMPYLVGVQARACAPVWAGFTRGEKAIEQVEEGPTIAEGIRVRHPVWAGSLLREITPPGGTFTAVEEEKILPAHHGLARRGIYVEPTSAVVWCALEQLLGKVPDPVILIMTGSGLKYHST